MTLQSLYLDKFSYSRGIYIVLTVDAMSAMSPGVTWVILYFFTVQFAALPSHADFKSVRVLSSSTPHDDQADENRSISIPFILCVSDQLHSKV